MISERLGADSGLTESDFDGIEYFSTHELLNSIGYATSDIAKMGLGVVAKRFVQLKGNQQAIMPDNNISYNSERSSNYERNHLHNAGRLSDSGSIITGTAGGNTRQMGTDEKEYLKQHHKIMYYNLMTSCQLTQYLAETEQRALKLEDELIKEMSVNRG